MGGKGPKGRARSAWRTGTQRAGVFAGRVLGKAPEMNQTPSTTAFDVTLADGSRERIDAEKVFVADASLMFSVAGHPTHIFGDAGSLGCECS